MATAGRVLGTRDLDPSDRRYFGFEWATLLAGSVVSGQSLSQSEWSVPTGITKVSDSISGTKTIILMDATGTTEGDTFVLANKITTSSGEEAERSFTIKIKEQ